MTFNPSGREFHTIRQAIAAVRKWYRRRPGGVITIHHPKCDTRWAGPCSCTPRHQFQRQRSR